MKISPNDRIINTKDSDLQFRDGNIEQNKFKPSGLWYGIGTAWLDWIADEMPHWRQKYIYKIDVNLNKMLVLSSVYAVEDFASEYKVLAPNAGFFGIDYEKVSLKYSGIEFNPYFYELKHKVGMEWYYGIDVPSGCIWNKDAIIKITKLQ